MGLGHALFGFMRDPVRHDIGRNHHAAGVCLKIACWVNFVMVALAALIGVVFGLLVLVSAAFWDAIRDNFEGPPWFMDLGPVAAVLGAGIVLFMTFILVTLLLLYLWWKNHTYLLWNQVAPNAQVWATVLAVVMLALAMWGAGPFYEFSTFQDGSTATEAFSVGGWGDMVSLVLAVLILVFANVAASKGELDIGAQARRGEAEQPGEPPDQRGPA
jgi:hypothetical protein